MSSDPYKYFRVEAKDLLEQISRGVLDLERGSTSPHLIPKLLRWAHTLKGAARVVRQPRIADLAHEIEDALAPLRGGEGNASSELVSEVLTKLDDVGEHLASIDLPVVAEAPSEPRGIESERFVRCSLEDVDTLLESVATTHAHGAGLRDAAFELRRSRQVVGKWLDTAAALRGDRGSDGSTTAPLSAVGVELSTSLNSLERSLAAGLDGIDRELQQLRSVCEGLRQVAAKSVFPQLERAVRDTAVLSGKKVVLEAHGGDVKLDPDVLGRVRPALIQLMRNAVAHGIESPQERVALGKPTDGLVVVTVERRGSQIVFDCRDDGSGLDMDALRRSAVRAGLAADGAEKSSAAEVVRLLLGGGLSTSASVTPVAGRGIGLNIVGEAIHGLGGEVSVQAPPGGGTAFVLSVPASFASLDALLVEASGMAAAVPLHSVRRVVHLVASDVTASPEGPVILYEGEWIRLAPIEVLLGAALPRDDAAARAAVVVRDASGTVALGIERVGSVQSLLTKPLPGRALVAPIVSALYVDRHGTPNPVLDAAEIVRTIRASRAPLRALAAVPPPVLVIDDSLTTRMLEQAILETAGFDVDLATSAEEGLSMARDKRYGAFLVDVEMPGMSGFDFVERTRRDPVLRDVPAVLVTSRASPEDRERGERAGAAAHIAKSTFDQRLLLETIRELIQS